LVYVNGSWIPEPCVASQYQDLSDFGPIQVSGDSYFVLGDHRNSSNDSRVFGPVARRLINGRAVFTYWPKDHFGSQKDHGDEDQMNRDGLLNKSCFWSSRNLVAPTFHSLQRFKQPLQRLMHGLKSTPRFDPNCVSQAGAAVKESNNVASALASFAMDSTRDAQVIPEESSVLDYLSNPQSNPQHALSCAILNNLGGPWQCPRSCKLS
jgi:Signal peptidase, peptidase S26